MDSDLIAYSPIMQRPPLRWPNGARVALWIVPNIEHYEYLPKYVRTRDPWPRSPHPDVLGYSQRDYGNRVGLWRLFDLSDDLGLRCTVSLNMTVIQHYPSILEGMEKRDWELMSHGIYNTRYHWDFTPEEERAAMLESRAIHLALTGREQRGWFSPAITNTLNTFDLAAECGYDYTADLYHDDQPFPLNVKTGKLLSLPYTIDLNDVILHRRGEEADSFARQIRDYFDTVYAEGVEQGRVMCVALHPYWVGQPHRLRAVRSAFEYILSHQGVWQTTGAEIVDWYNANYLPLIESRSRCQGCGQWLNSFRPKFLRSTSRVTRAWTTLTIHFARFPIRHDFVWPGGARIAFTVTLILDHWELDAPASASPDPRIVSPLGKFSPDWLTWSHRLYGVRVGIFRILEVLDQFNLTPSVALGTEAARRYPELVDTLLRRDACFMAHGDYATRRITSRSTDERRTISAARDAIAAAVGQNPTGWCGQDFNESADTPALLAEAGFHYTTDWANDDRPYLLGPYPGGSLLALPPQPEWNDLECMWLRRVTPPVWSDNVIEAFTMLHEEGGNVFNLTLHPWITGQAHRIRYLRDLLHGILGKPHVWRTTTDALAEAARAQIG